jgi:hypothetical protein
MHSGRRGGAAVCYNFKDYQANERPKEEDKFTRYQPHANIDCSFLDHNLLLTT